MKLTITIEDGEQRTVMDLGGTKGILPEPESQPGATEEGPFDGGPARAVIDSEEPVAGASNEVEAGSAMDAGPAPDLELDGRTDGRPPAPTGPVDALGVSEP